MASKKILVLADIDDGLSYHEFRKSYKELVTGLTQKDISMGYKLYKDRQEDRPIVIPISKTDMDAANSAYKKYNEVSTKIGTNKISNFVWSYYTKDKRGQITTKDFSSDISNRIETCYRDVLKNGGEMCKHMKINFLSMRWQKSREEVIDVVRRRNTNDISTLKETDKVPSYREIPSRSKSRSASKSSSTTKSRSASKSSSTAKSRSATKEISKKVQTKRFTPIKKKCCS